MGCLIAFGGMWAQTEESWGVRYLQYSGPQFLKWKNLDLSFETGVKGFSFLDVYRFMNLVI